MLELQITITRHPLSISDGKNVLSSTPVKIGKYLSNVHKMEGTNLQCMHTHYAKFEYKAMETVWVTDYTN